jgi:hypothetical protein
VSPPSSFTDSPNGNYANNQNKLIRTQNAIDLTDATSATITFLALWDLEAYYDQVQIVASPDLTNWSPLCGRYTRPGYAFQDEGAPLYDGQRPEWIREEVDLSGFIGAPVWIGFRLITDLGGNYDGFYCDDVAVTITGLEPSGIEGAEAITLLHPQPNPATDHTWITYAIRGTSNAGTQLHLYDAVGAWVKTISLNSDKGSYQLFTGDLAPGIYHFTVGSGTEVAPLKKLVVLRN